MLKKKTLELELQKVRGFKDPDPSMEQYMTPASIAADLIFSAYSNGDIAGLKVMDLGCGTGMLSLGAWYMDAGMVIGFDGSEDALVVARENASDAEAEIQFIKSDISEVTEMADTVIMNPPFGCQKAHADRPFLDKALETSDCVYSIHMSNTVEFLENFCDKRGKDIFWRRTYKYDIPHLFSFHTKDKQTVELVAVGIR